MCAGSSVGCAGSSSEIVAETAAVGVGATAASQSVQVAAAAESRETKAAKSTAQALVPLGVTANQMGVVKNHEKFKSWN